MSKTKAPLKTELEILKDQLQGLEKQKEEMDKNLRANIFLTTIIIENIKKYE